jgi:class 3 adenylate cyclase/tetratricopeptide (TPR) repeat protein
VDSADKFCAECGTPLGQTPQPVRTPAQSATESPAQERRFISALFIDIVGFTPLTEERDSEEVRQMLTRYFDRAREIVERFGGVIDKYIGDAVMAVWGAHVAHEDDAERAVRAALELVEAVEELGRTEGMDGLRARAGVLSGEAAVGGDGNATTGLIIGDTVNTASRLQSAAAPGTVLVGPSTRDLASNAIEFESAGLLDLKGKSEPVEAFRALRVVGGHRGARRADGLVPPFVGRGDELRLLKDNLHAVERDGRLRMVSIVGQGGIGKSRLADELWNYVDGLTDTVYWHHGRSPAYGESLEYWAVGEMVRQRCGIAAGEDDHRARTRLRTTLAEFVPDSDDRAWMEPRLESLLGLSGEVTADREEFFAAWRLLFTNVATRGPAVMVFEDLHWADDGMLDFIEDFVSVADAPILVVTLARPDILDRRPGWGSGRANSLSAHLAPLAAATMMELVRGVVKNASGPVLDRIVGHAGGIPLYAVELLRMLMAQGMLAPTDDGRYELTGDAGDIEIPDSLHGMVGARLDQFDPAERSLIADAAILGQSFTLEGLVTLQGGRSEDLEIALEPLVRREILSVNRDPRSPERGQYRFVQSIIREVAHQRVSRADRYDRHVKVAEYYDSLGLPEVAGVVASHYLDALEASPDGAGSDDLRVHVLDALLAAADRAGALQSHSQVVRLCKRGIDLSSSPDERGELLIRAARAAHAGLDPDAERYAREAGDAFEAAGKTDGVLRAATTLARLLDDVNRSNEAWPMLEPLVERAGTEVTPEALGELSRSLMLDGEWTRSLEWCDRALALAEEQNSIPVFVDTLITKGTGLGIAHRTREALILLEAGLELSREHQLAASKRRVLRNLAYVGSSDTWNPGLSIERLEDARRLGDPRHLAEAIVERANGLLESFEWEESSALLDELDPLDLTPEVADGYWGVVLTRRLWSEADAAPVVSERMARRDQLAGVGDSQMLAGFEYEVIQEAIWLGRFEEAYERAASNVPVTPVRLDLWFRMLSSILMNDHARVQATLTDAEANPYRGRHTDTMRHATRGGSSALAGDIAAAESEWRGALELAAEAYPIQTELTMVALACHSLGAENRFGRECGRRAYDLLFERGAMGFMAAFSTGLVEPAEESSARETG